MLHQRRKKFLDFKMNAVLLCNIGLLWNFIVMKMLPCFLFAGNMFLVLMQNFMFKLKHYLNV